MTPAIERLLQLAEVARTRIQSLSPVADALVYELGEAIREVEEEDAEKRSKALSDLIEADADLIIEDRRRENGE